MPATKRSFAFHPLVLIALGFLLDCNPVAAQEEAEAVLVAPVLFVTSAQSHQPQTEEICREFLISEEDVIAREEAAKPFYLRRDWLTGAAGGLVGGYIGDRFGQHRLPITIVSMLGGFMVGKALGAKLFPLVPPLGPDTDLPPQVFLRDSVCAQQLLYTYDSPLYHVVYRFGDAEFSADVPFDPGEALLLDASGKVLGPARVRVD